MRLILVRHGETPSNLIGSLDTAAPGPGLTDLGHEQAAAVPAALAKEEIDSLWVSTLVRTHLTCAPLAKALGLEPTQLPGVHEIQAGELEKKTDHDSVHTYLVTLKQWVEGDLEARIPGGESGTEAIGRFDESVARVEASGARTAVIFSHGAMIRLWAHVRVPAIREQIPHREPLPNTGIVVLEGSSAQGWEAVSWLDTALVAPDPDPDPYDGPMGQPFENA